MSVWYSLASLLFAASTHQTNTPTATAPQATTQTGMSFFWQWQLGFLQSWELCLVFLGPLCFFLLSVLGVAIRVRCAGKKTSHTPFKNHKSCRGCLRAFRSKLTRGFYVEWRARQSLEELVEQAQPRESQDSRTLSRYSKITEGDVLKTYPGELGPKVILFLRFASVFVTGGMSSVDIQIILDRVAVALKMPTISHLVIGLTDIQVQFMLRPLICVCCASDCKLSLLSDAQRLATLVERGHADVNACLTVLDQIQEYPIVYGWLVRLAALYVCCTLAPAAVYKGGYQNISDAAMIAPFVLLGTTTVEYFKLGVWETPLVSFTVGLLSPIVWRYSGSEQCQAYYTFGVLLCWLPGSSLVYGAHEIMHSSFVNGSARFSKGIVQAMLIALFYTLGWQYWGRDWSSNETRNGNKTNLYGTTGPIASMPPSLGCISPWVDDLPWYTTAIYLMMPLNLASLIVFNVRLRDSVAVFTVAQITYAVQGILHGCANTQSLCALPYYVQVFFVLFIQVCINLCINKQTFKQTNPQTNEYINK